MALNHTQQSKDDSIASLYYPIYDEMRERQLKAIRTNNGMRVDPFFPNDDAEDTRRCLALSAVLDNAEASHFTDKYYELQEKLKAMGGLHFDRKDTQGQLHWTLMQLVGFADYDEHNNDQMPVYRSAQYLDCLEDTLTIHGLTDSLSIQFVGVICVSTGLLMAGIPSKPMNVIRDAVRTKLKERGLPLQEPFVNDICHATLFRVTRDSNESHVHEQLMELAREYQNVDLGTVTIHRLQIGPASWCMQKQELEATPPWREWSLDLQETEMGVCRSLNASSGAALAKELKVVLCENENDSESLSRNAATLTGAGGLTLAGELRKRLDDERKLLEATYYIDFH